MIVLAKGSINRPDLLAPLDAVRERVDTLPFVVEGLLTFDFDEIYEI
jgi:hypothetical protein